MEQQATPTISGEAKAYLEGMKMALDMVHSGLGITLARKVITKRQAMAVKADISEMIERTLIETLKTSQ